MTLPAALQIPVIRTALRPGDWRLAAWARLADAVAPGAYQLDGTWSTATPEVPEAVVYYPHEPINAEPALVFALADYGERPAQVRAFLELAVVARTALPLLLDRVAQLEAALGRVTAQRDAAWEPATRR